MIVFRSSLLILILARSVVAFPAAPEVVSGKMVGVVTGAESRPAPRVPIHLVRRGQPPFSTDGTTSDLGYFSLGGLPPGVYDLEVGTLAGLHCQKSHLEIGSGMTLELKLALVPAPGRSPCLDLPLVGEVWWSTEFSEFSKAKLPSTGNIWSILESQEPTTVTDRVDVGGLKTGVPALFGALGASWTENQYTLNGLNVTDPYVPGRPLSEPELDSTGEVRVTSGAKPAPWSGSGVTLAITTEGPFENLRGSARVFYSDRKLEADNLDARLRQLGAPGLERLKHLEDGHFEIGGRSPLGAIRSPAFVSLSTQRLSKNLGGFAAPIAVRVYRSLVELTPLAGNSRRLELLFAGQHVSNSREGAAPEVAPTATRLRDDNFYQSQMSWHTILTPSSILSLGFGTVHAIVSSGIQQGVVGVSTLDLPLATRTGAAPLSMAGVRWRYQANTTLEVGRGSHNFDLGLGWDRSSISNRWDSLGGRERVLVNGSGAEVVQWNTPTQARARVENIALFAQDRGRGVGRLRFPLGLRFETSSGRAAGVEQGIRWITLVPRAGFALPLSRQGLVLRGSWSRYGHLVQGRYLDYGNPLALSNQRFRWPELGQPQELTERLEVRGGRYSALDPGLARPFTDEISVGLEKYFAGSFRVAVRFFRRDDHRLIGLLNIGVPLSSYTPVQVLDPGNDGIPGTGDDHILILYERNPSALGRDFHLLTNVAGDRASYKGFEIRVNKPVVRRWEFSGSFTGMQTLGPTSPGNSVFDNDTGFVGSLYTDPNTLLFDTSRTYFDRAFIGKVTGYYAAPRGFELSAVGKYYDGLPFGRLLFVNGFNQGPFFVRVTPRGHPGGFQTQFNATVDLRVARDFALGRGTLSGYLDFFNVLNMNRNTVERDLTGPEFQRRMPLAFEPPRIARLGVEWKF